MTKPEQDKTPDDLLEELGGCGRYQWRLAITLHLIQMIVAFSLNSIIIISATPSWWCSDMELCLETNTSAFYRNETSVCSPKTCDIIVDGNETRKCEHFHFERDETFVSEWGLVCGSDYLPALIQSLEISGLLLGHIISGQVADLIGRKVPLYSSIIVIVIFNMVGFFSVNWAMFAASRFFLGIGFALFLTINYALISEYTLTRWRVWATGFPSWPIEQCLFALCAWLLKDWRYIQLLCALLGVPFLFCWWWIPQSFRWYIAHDQMDKAKRIVQVVATLNKKEIGDIKICNIDSEISVKKYSFLHLFKTRYLIRITVLASINWLGLGLISYGLAFAVQSLSGNIYLNFAMFSVIGIPSLVITNLLQNKLGRRVTAILCYCLVAVIGAVTGSVQIFDAPNKDILTRVFIMIAQLGIGAAWGPSQTMTVELYPTVIRTLAFGSLSVVGRAGAMLGPQLAYLNTYFPGILFYCTGVIAIMCTIACLNLPETKDSMLEDKKANKRNYTDIGTPK